MVDVIRLLNQMVVHICQLLAIIVITIGVFRALYIFLKGAVFSGDLNMAFRDSRLDLGYSFSLGLGFLIGASILNTALAPTWNDIGQLTAIIAIRTILNYFLVQDIDRHTSLAGEVVRNDTGTEKSEKEATGRPDSAIDRVRRLFL